MNKDKKPAQSGKIIRGQYPGAGRDVEERPATADHPAKLG